MPLMGGSREFLTLSGYFKSPRLKKGTFIGIDALDECAARHRVKLLDSLSQILERSPGSRMFVGGRQHIPTEIGRRVSGMVTGVSISTEGDDIIRYFHTKLDETVVWKQIF